MINPYILEPGYRKVRTHKLPRGKFYNPMLGNFATKVAFHTATAALNYARRAKVRWCRKYDLAISTMVEAAR